MTQYNKATLDTFFNTGDIPSGTDFANLIDSQINASEVVTQTMAGPLSTPQLLTTNLSVNGTVSAGNTNINGQLKAASVLVNGNVSAATVAVSGFGIIYSRFVASAAGTAQGTATPLLITMTRLQGITDGVATGFVLNANSPGRVQYLINETAVSGNLYPPVGGKINALSTNIPFPLAANTPYVVYHTLASAYWVK